MSGDESDESDKNHNPRKRHRRFAYTETPREEDRKEQDHAHRPDDASYDADGSESEEGEIQIEEQAAAASFPTADGALGGRLSVSEREGEQEEDESPPRPLGNAQPDPPTMEEPLPVNPPRFPRPEITVKEDVNFLLFLAYITEEAFADVFARHEMFCAAYSRQQHQLPNVDAGGSNVVGQILTGPQTTYHTEGLHGVDVPTNTVRFVFSLWFVFKNPQRKREKSSRYTRQRMKMPSRASLQLTWDFFYERLHAIEAIVQRLLDGARAAPFFRQAIRLALPQDHGEDNQSDNNQSDCNQNDDSE